ncbi:hypothetical protein FOL47_000222 [Perkinsus chesapeaki]|uniref:Uncharacterized protein n=1 Tax=Perkinsus chesapeaki TaxID=330153 RepID=A0A7J6KWI5_PERCH|nr:hypothetical protein FOL47_000222 [Perkinsus chesapeaki]
MAKSSQKDVEVAVTPDGAPVLIKGGSQLSFDFENSQREEPTRYGPSSAQFLKVFFTWSSAVLIVQTAISNGTNLMVHKLQSTSASNQNVVDVLPSGDDSSLSEDAAQASTDLRTAVAPHHFMAYLSRLLEAAASHGWKAAVSADARIRQKVDDLVRSEHMTFPQALTNEMVASPIIVDVVASMQIDNLRRNYNNTSSAKQFTNRKRAKIDNGLSKTSTDFGSSRDSMYGKGKGREQKSSSSTTSHGSQSMVQSSKSLESKST